MTKVIQFPGKKEVDIGVERRPIMGQSIHKTVHKPLEQAREGVLNRIPPGRFAELLPKITEEQNVLESMIAALQFYMIGGHDGGAMASKAFAKFIQSQQPQPPSAA